MTSAAERFRAPPWLERWQASRTPRERGVIAALIVVVVVAIAWLAIWQPLQRDLAVLAGAAPAEKRALAHARRMADEMAALGRNAPARRPAEARAELERILNERGARGAVTSLDWQDGRARIVFADVRVETLVALLESLERDAQLRIVEGTLTARVEPGTVRAELTLAR